MSYPITVRGIQTAADWTSQNPILSQFELGIETDPATGAYGKCKLGDGIHHWTSLSYFNPAGSSGGGGGESYEVATESPATGSNATFTFTGPPTLVFRNGVMETSLGTVAGNTFVFDSNPNLNDVIEGLV